MEYVLFIFICAVAIQAFMFYTRWLYTSRKLPKIKILEFFKLYKVNADVWVLEDSYVKYNRRYQYNSETKTSTPAYDCELGFHLLGFLIYVIWHRYYEYTKEKRKNAQVYIDFCHAAKKILNLAIVMNVTSPILIGMIQQVNLIVFYTQSMVNVR